MAPPVDPTPRSAYAHWNEDQDYMWGEEVGKHAATQADEPPDPEEYYDSEDWYKAWERDDPDGEAEENDEGLEDEDD